MLLGPLGKGSRCIADHAASVGINIGTGGIFKELGLIGTQRLSGEDDGGNWPGTAGQGFPPIAPVLNVLE